MLNFKKIVLTLFTTCSSLSFAGSMGPSCEPGNINTPCTTNPWHIGGQALYLQPSFGGNGLGYTTFSNYSGNDNNGVFTGSSGAPDYMSNIYPKWGWGFELDGAYQLVPATDLTVNWYHLKTSRQGNFPIGYAFSGNNDGFYGGQFKVASTWNEVDIAVGHLIQLTSTKTARIHAGAEFAGIKNQFHNSPRLNPTSVIAYNTVDKLSYNGFGPRLGLDLTYIFRESIEFYANMAGSLLVGRTKQTNSGYQNYPYPNNPISPFITGNYHQSNSGVIVPELAAKLGAQYTMTMEQYQLSFDMGYLWINYLNSIVGYSGNGIVFANVGNNTTANFNINGLYFGLKWLGNA